MVFNPFAGLDASWRGIPFKVENESGEGGRRGPLHEYPDRDTPYFEDMGRAADKFSISAYFVGDLADLTGRLFEAALRKPGSGLLIHPTRGRQTVVCTHWRRQTSRSKANWVEYTLSFVEAGRNLMPAASTSWPNVVLDAVNRAQAAFSDVLSQGLNLTGLSSEAGDMLIGNATALGLVLNNQTLMTAGLAPSSAIAAAGLLTSGYVSSWEPGLDTVLLATATVALLGAWASAFAGPSPDRTSSMRAINGLFGVYDTAASDQWYAAVAITPLQAAELSNQAAFSAAIRRSSLAEAARLAVSIDFATYDEAAALRSRFADAFDEEINAAIDSTVARSVLLDLSSATLTAISVAGADKAKLVPYRIGTPRPALVLAQMFYPDDPTGSARAAELTARTGAIHPAFLPVQGERLSK